MRRDLPCLGLLVAVLAVLGGCENSVDPTLGTEQAFTIWGALDPTAGQQALRVVPIQGAIDADPAEIDAEVTATDLTTGETVAFRDSFVTFEAGTSGHVFLADWTPRPGRAYRIVARRTADGAESTAEVEVPTLATPRVEALSGLSGVLYEVWIGGVPRVQFGQVVFRVSGLPSAPDDTVAVTVLDRDRVRAAGSGWERDIEFLPTARDYLNSAGFPSRSVRLVDVTYRMYVTDRAWVVPEEGFDLDQIVEPGTVSNVTGGFGLVAAGYWTEVTWVPSISTQARAGFFVADDPAAQVVVNEINLDGWVELYNPTLEPVSIAGYGVTEVSGVPPAMPLPPGTVIGPKGFYVASIGLTDIQLGTTVYLVNSRGEVVGGLSVRGVIPTDDFGTRSYGPYPDGRSYRLPSGGDLFHGLLVESPGEPNIVDFLYYAINEINADEGWVELLNPPGIFPPRGVELAYSADDWAQGRVAGVSAMEGRFRLVRSNEFVEVSRTGGELLAVCHISADLYRVVDARTYGPQSSGMTSGLVPDGLLDFWQGGLSPTPLASNATAFP